MHDGRRDSGRLPQRQPRLRVDLDDRRDRRAPRGLLGVQFRSQRYVPPVYWLAILFTFALGTAAGDLFAEKGALGFWVSALIFGGAIALIAAAYFWLAIDAVLAFWPAYILTRPLGASIGDGLSQPSGNGGLGLGTTGTSYLFLACILALVAFLSFTKRDQTPAEVATCA